MATCRGKLEIDEHYLDINMGIILLGIAEFWVLPAIVNLPAPVDNSGNTSGVYALLNHRLSSDNRTTRTRGFCEDEIVPLC